MIVQLITFFGIIRIHQTEAFAMSLKQKITLERRKTANYGLKVYTYIHNWPLQHFSQDFGLASRYTCEADKVMQNDIEQSLQLRQGRNGPLRTF